MTGCCENALANFKIRSTIDKNPRIVRVNIPGRPFHVYYRSDDYIDNSESRSIPKYAGHPSNAPKEFYGKGKYIIDEFLMSVV